MPEGYKAPTSLSPEESEALKALGMPEHDSDATFVIKPVEEMSSDHLAEALRALITESRLPELEPGDIDFDSERNRVSEMSDAVQQVELAEYNKAMMSLETTDQQLDYWLANRSTIQALVEATEQQRRITDALGHED